MLGCKSSAENDSVVCAECPFTAFYLKDNIPLPAADDMGLLLRAVFLTQICPDEDINLMSLCPPRLAPPASTPSRVSPASANSLLLSDSVPSLVSPTSANKLVSPAYATNVVSSTFSNRLVSPA
ncbi:hypothetical protein PoB_002861100 [Plakobranchus ocellatus]|uniref:Uncharacterized protein n=1 Tax=Plakobranchus ocellatus TaxID=259542 RepID=A0AAV4A1R6_9GAST|nr:hypothetical protein PoB_002861100 [Plakobranchus ocellatus]